MAVNERMISAESAPMSALHTVPFERPEPDALLLDDVEEFIARFVELPTLAHRLVVATYIIHTWAIEVAYVTPYLYISSAGPGTGKSRTMDLLSVLVRNADTGTDAPVHVLGQEIEANCPTLFFDEADTIFAGRANNPIKRILNIGYKRGAVIKRQRANVVESWSVYCCKVLAGIRNNHLPQSLLTRCIPIEMRPRQGELERFNQFHLVRDPGRRELVDRIAGFAEEFSLDIANQRPEPLKALDDRQNEICEPLVAIATVLGKEAELREALRQVFSRGEAPMSQEQAFLLRIRQAFEEQERNGGPRDRIHTEQLLSALGPMYNARLLGILLGELGFVRTEPETLRIEASVKRGYARSDLQPLFDRYLDNEMPALHAVEDDA
jgi:hypothetical protein